MTTKKITGFSRKDFTTQSKLKIKVINTDARLFNQKLNSLIRSGPEVIIFNCNITLYE
jgi:hypothetical protein